jgi:uncharacterized protein YjbI with pentapeptide repeats
MQIDKDTSKSHPLFSDEQIRAKALERWKARNTKPGSPEDDWEQAIQELESELSSSKRVTYIALRTTQQVLDWTGFKEKKLWDFLQLLFVPLVLAIVGVGFQQFAKEREYSQQKADREREQLQQRADKEREQLQQRADKEKELEVANDRERQKILSDYFDQMAVLLQQKLLYVSVESEIFSIAQSKTVTALQSLDPRRQQAIIQYLEAAGLNLLDSKKGLLYESRMSKVDLRKGNFSGSVFKNSDFSLSRLSGIDFSGAVMRGSDLNSSDLTGAKLGGIDLSQANLRGTGLVSSDLRVANLISADLTGADLTGADLTGANLAAANLEEVKNLTESQLSSAYLCKTSLPPMFEVLANKDCQELKRLKTDKR